MSEEMMPTESIGGTGPDRKTPHIYTISTLTDDESSPKEHSTRRLWFTAELGHYGGPTSDKRRVRAIALSQLQSLEPRDGCERTLVNWNAVPYRKHLAVAMTYKPLTAGPQGTRALVFS
jgi:hypothetical protein